MSQILNYCSSSQNLGGFRRVRIAESKLIYQQDFQTETELDEILFLANENWTAEWELYDDFQTEFKIESKIEDFFSETHSFRIIIEVDVLPSDFLRWYRTAIQNRRFAVELQNNNGFTRCLNPFFIAYTYIGEISFAKKNKYELSFQRAKLIQNTFILSFEAIVKKKYFSQTIPLNEVTIQPNMAVDLSLYKFGYSDSLHSQIIYTDSNVINLYKEGTFFFWMIHSKNPTINYVTSINLLLKNEDLHTGENSYIVGDGTTTPDSDVQIGD